MRIQLKFHQDADAEERRRVLDELPSVERLFPGEDDPELEAFYVADLPDNEAETTLADLKRSKAVAFAEPQAERKLHLPEELKGR
jgi:uncharacterized pyridoxamine 5'-phosphate oxidase family protein